MEIQEHRLAVHRDQDVRRLDVHVHQPPRVGIVERIGEARGDPGHGFDIRGLHEAATERPVRAAATEGVARVWRSITLMSSSPVRSSSGTSARSSRMRARLVPPRNGMQSPRRPRSGNVCSEKSGTMCVCRSRASARCSSSIVRDDLHDDRPVGQARVGGQKRAPGPTPPELGQQQERAEHLAGLGIIDDASAATGSADRTRKGPAARPPSAGNGRRPRPLRRSGPPRGAGMSPHRSGEWQIRRRRPRGRRATSWAVTSAPVPRP